MFDESVQNYHFRISRSEPNNPTTKFISLIPRGSRVLEDVPMALCPPISPSE